MSDFWPPELPGEHAAVDGALCYDCLRRRTRARAPAQETRLGHLAGAERVSWALRATGRRKGGVRESQNVRTIQPTVLIFTTKGSQAKGCGPPPTWLAAPEGTGNLNGPSGTYITSVIPTCGENPTSNPSQWPDVQGAQQEGRLVKWVPEASPTAVPPVEGSQAPLPGSPGSRPRSHLPLTGLVTAPGRSRLPRSHRHSRGARSLPVLEGLDVPHRP